MGMRECGRGGWWEERKVVGGVRNMACHFSCGLLSSRVLVLLVRIILSSLESSNRTPAGTTQHHRRRVNNPTRIGGKEGEGHHNRVLHPEWAQLPVPPSAVACVLPALAAPGGCSPAVRVHPTVHHYT